MHNNISLRSWLISDEDVENYEGWISENHETLFGNELEGWYTDKSLWPQKREYKTFSEWFDVECHSLIIFKPIPR